MPTAFAIDLQLLGGVWMIQVFPAVVLGLFTRRFSGGALLVGWAAGMSAGTWLSAGPTAWVPTHVIWGTTILVYNGLTSLLLNIGVASVLSVFLPNRAGDATTADREDLVPAA